MLKKLVLFDIDGTLMDTDGAGNEPFVQALTEVFERSFSAEGYSSSGKTDTQIALELAEQFGVSREEAMPRLPEVRERYLEKFEPALAAIQPTVFPGVPELVAAVSEHEDCVNGLLTGNFEPAGWMKVGRIGLTDAFEMGSFGDDAPARSDLPDKAVQNVLDLTGRKFEGKDIVIIGDTPNDVACGRHLNVKSIAVATGNFGEAELEAAQPDHLFADFADTWRVVEAILA